MDQNFCRHYKGDCYPPSNRYCRVCTDAEPKCNKLWQKIVDLSNSNCGQPVIIPGTRAVMLPNPDNWDILHLKINVTWKPYKRGFSTLCFNRPCKNGQKGAETR